MKELKDMNREELMEVIRIKNVMIKELEEELEAYRELAEQQQKLIGNKDNMNCGGL
ncbi:MAG: hypothetical protein N3B21_09420 [Clostridia bacterium]|nr:hypothetical protein [Clostridia bacterium]